MPSTTNTGGENIPSQVPKKYVRGAYGKMIVNPKYVLYAMALKKEKKQEGIETNINTKTGIVENSKTISKSLMSSASQRSQSQQSSSEQLAVPIDDNINNSINIDDRETEVTTMMTTMNVNNDDSVNVNNYKGRISLAYLARLAGDVYNFDTTESKRRKDQQQQQQELQSRSESESVITENKNEIIEVGPDKFMIHEITSTTLSSSNSPSQSQPMRTLIVAICGTFSPVQHVMNIMPHAYQSLYTAKEIFGLAGFGSGDGSSGSSGGTGGLSDIQTSMRNLTHSNDANTNTNNIQTTHAEDAYTAGHEHGWTEPAQKIYQEVLTRIGVRNGYDGNDGNDGEENNNNNSLNNKFDRIFVIGHSRGGLLAYYVGLNILRQQHQHEYGASGASADAGYTGLLRVVGFGMPPPLQTQDPQISHFIQNNVISIVNRHDPVANGSLPSFVSNQNWDPILVEIGPKLKKNKKPPKRPKSTTTTAHNSSSSSSSSSLWGLLGQVVTSTVSAVADKATELQYDIEQNHGRRSYEKLMTVQVSSNGNDNNIDIKTDNDYVLPSCVIISNDDEDDNNKETRQTCNRILQLLLP